MMNLINVSERQSWHRAVSLRQCGFHVAKCGSGEIASHYSDLSPDSKIRPISESY